MESLGGHGASASKDVGGRQQLEVLAETVHVSFGGAEALQRVEAWAGAVWAGWRVAGSHWLRSSSWAGRAAEALWAEMAGRAAAALCAGWLLADSHWLSGAGAGLLGAGRHQRSWRKHRQ